MSQYEKELRYDQMRRSKDSGLEIDFVIRWRGECTLVEVKAETGNAKSAATILKHPEKYHVNQCIKLGNYNVGRSGKILTLPLYMGFLLYEVSVKNDKRQRNPLTGS